MVDPRPEFGTPQAVPAWRAHTAGETLAGVALAILAAAILQWFLPPRLRVVDHWVVPVISLALLGMLAVIHPRRINRRAVWGRVVGLSLLGLFVTANVVSGARLVLEIVGQRPGPKDPVDLLLSGASVWLMNVIVFSLVFWELDRGGPASRALGIKRYTDFMFPQMVAPDLVPPGWEPTYIDYLYLAFTNATAFSPTDVMPLTRPAKLAMMVQATLSVTLVGLVVARSINLLAA